MLPVSKNIFIPSAGIILFLHTTLHIHPNALRIMIVTEIFLSVHQFACPLGIENLNIFREVGMKICSTEFIIHTYFRRIKVQHLGSCTIESLLFFILNKEQLFILGSPMFLFYSRYEIIEYLLFCSIFNS